MHAPAADEERVAQLQLVLFAVERGRTRPRRPPCGNAAPGRGHSKESRTRTSPAMAAILSQRVEIGLRPAKISERAGQIGIHGGYSVHGSVL